MVIPSNSIELHLSTPAGEVKDGVLSPANFKVLFSNPEYPDRLIVTAASETFQPGDRIVNGGTVCVVEGVDEKSGTLAIRIEKAPLGIKGTVEVSVADSDTGGAEVSVDTSDLELGFRARAALKLGSLSSIAADLDGKFARRSVTTPLA